MNVYRFYVVLSTLNFRLADHDITLFKKVPIL